MNIRSRNDFDITIRHAWPEGEELILSLLILAFIADHPGTIHIPFSRLSEIAREASLDDAGVVPKVVQYLTGADTHLLDIAGELIGDDDLPHMLDNEEFSLAITGINPLTGDTDPELPNKLFVYFRPSRLAQKVLWENHAK